MASSARPETLALQRLYQWEQTTPDKTVFTQPMGGGVVREWTWKQAVEEVRRMAAYLKGLNLEPGTRIALLSKNTAHWMMADWAIWMAGHVSVPLYPTLAANTVRQILEHSESKLLFVGKLDGWDGMKAGVPGGLPCIACRWRPRWTPPPRWDEIIARTAPLAGEPVRPGRRAVHHHVHLGHHRHAQGRDAQLRHLRLVVTSGLKRVPLDQRTPHAELPAAGARGRAHAGRAWPAGHRHAGVLRREPGDLHADLQRARPTVFFSVPRLWVKFQQGVQREDAARPSSAAAEDPDPARHRARKRCSPAWASTRSSGPPAAPRRCRPLLRLVRSLGLDIVEVYGMTENCGLSHSTVLGKPRPGTVGTTYEGVQCRIDPGNGEIQVKGECVMLGYYKNPEVTAATFTDDGWLKTGDKGAIDSAGDLRITGRVKDLFKTGKGKYVAPAPIENKLATHPAIEACCVTGANLGQPLALLMLNPEAAAKARDAAGRSALEASLAEHLKAVNAQLDPHEQMECLVVTADPWSVENDILTPTMKVKRNKIEDLFAQNYERWATARKKVVWI
jgi:long-chain acyl-CoA synthetase